MASSDAKTRFTDSQASVFLDLIRGTAALLVLVVHLRNMFFLNYPEAIRQGGSRFLLLPYILSSGAHQAVILFFVLSGYLVGGSIIRTLRKGQWTWSSYLTHRMVRLWIVLVPGLILCFLWDSAGMASHRMLYHGIIQNYETGDIYRSHTFKAFIGNIFFLQTILVPAYGSDGPLWSLSYEFWYYLLFPAGLIALRREFSVRTRVMALIGFACGAWFTGKWILLMLPIWILGAALTLIPVRKMAWSFRCIAVMVYVPIIFVFSRFDRWTPLLEDYLFACVSAAFLWVMCSATGKANDTELFSRASRRLSAFSYTLYVVHQPLLLFAASYLIGTVRWFPSKTHILEGSALFVLTVVYAYGIAVMTEFRTTSIRRWLEQRIF
jgi:peptidoglycan/LPS O-acetylase OafA/YrhL